jgi:hypothetical protein
MRRGMGQMLHPTVVRVLKRLHYPLDVMLTCVRWSSATSSENAPVATACILLATLTDLSCQYEE